MIEAGDMEAAIGRVQDFMAVQGCGSEDALELHLQAAGIEPEAVFRLIDLVAAGQPWEAADAVAMVVTQTAASVAIAGGVRVLATSPNLTYGAAGQAHPRARCDPLSRPGV
jgi:predicted DCC family thiol-disulfide oxidoreductase YuxK